MKKWRSMTVGEKVMIVILSIFTPAFPIFAIIIIPTVFVGEFGKETLFLIFLFAFFVSFISMYCCNKVLDITGSFEKRGKKLDAMEREADLKIKSADKYFEDRKKNLDFMEREAEAKKKDADKYFEDKKKKLDADADLKIKKADKYYESKVILGDLLFKKKQTEANEYVNKRKSEADVYVIQRKQIADDYYNRKFEQIDEHKRKQEEEIDNLRSEFDDEVEEWKTSDSIWSIRYDELQQYKKRFGVSDSEQVKAILRKEFPFTYSASMSADFESALFEEVEKRLIWKPQPARSAAETVNEVKRKFRQSQSAFKVMLYKYEFLLNTFPELRKYVDDEKGLITIADANSYEDFTDNYDRVRNYLTDEEYRKLTVTQRNQLALDNYNARSKSNWVIGTEYEMYCEHILKEEGFETIDYGVRKRLNDLGRDIIAKRGDTTYIIQCKRWSLSKEIHENVICQLFGTTIEYNIQRQAQNHNPTLFDEDLVVVPLLFTTTALSETAKAFADKLGVKVCVKAMGEYPQIKCNINNGNKIYHLPFDQQYYTTRIEKNGEKYAWTVEEAERSGFRRAFRWQGTTNA